MGDKRRTKKGAEPYFEERNRNIMHRTFHVKKKKNWPNFFTKSITWGGNTKLGGREGMEDSLTKGDKRDIVIKGGMWPLLNVD